MCPFGHCAQIDPCLRARAHHFISIRYYYHHHYYVIKYALKKITFWCYNHERSIVAHLLATTEQTKNTWNWISKPDSLTPWKPIWFRLVFFPFPLISENQRQQKRAISFNGVQAKPQTQRKENEAGHLKWFNLWDLSSKGLLSFIKAPALPLQFMCNQLNGFPFKLITVAKGAFFSLLRFSANK